MLVVVLAVLAPLASVLLRAVWVDGQFSLEALSRILGQSRTWRLVALTVGQAAASTIAAVAVGLPVAYVLYRREFRGRRLLRTVATIPFVLPSVVVAAAFASLLGPTGPVDLRGTWWAIIAAHVCFNLAVVVRITGSAMAAVDADLEDSARLAGLSPRRVKRTVLLPLVAPSLRAASVIVFLFCLTSFGVIVVLGGGWVTTIEVEMWTRATRQFDLPGAAVLAGIQAATVFAVLALWGTGQSYAGSASGRARIAPRRAATSAERLSVLWVVAAVGIVSVLPLAALVERSMRAGDGFGFANWVDSIGGQWNSIAVDPLSAVKASLLAAVPACVGRGVLLGVPAARAVVADRSGVRRQGAVVALAVSATTIGLGLLLVGPPPALELRAGRCGWSWPHRRWWRCRWWSGASRRPWAGCRPSTARSRCWRVHRPGRCGGGWNFRCLSCCGGSCGPGAHSCSRRVRSDGVRGQAQHPDHARGHRATPVQARAVRYGSGDGIVGAARGSLVALLLLIDRLGDDGVALWRTLSAGLWARSWQNDSFGPCYRNLPGEPMWLFQVTSPHFFTAGSAVSGEQSALRASCGSGVANSIRLSHPVSAQEVEVLSKRPQISLLRSYGCRRTGPDRGGGRAGGRLHSRWPRWRIDHHDHRRPLHHVDHDALVEQYDRAREHTSCHDDHRRFHRWCHLRR
ncbi:MAG: iron ABC transporter permease [Microthrixaceae bacterium]